MIFVLSCTKDYRYVWTEEKEHDACVVTITVKIPTRTTREVDVFIANCPLLDVVTQGCTKIEARQHLVEAVTAFLVTCLQMNTFDQVMKQCGLAPVGNTPAASDDDCFDHLDIPLPLAAAKTFDRACHA